ncbi:uncharacterized protein BDZ99DRAFT_474224 [Mytilinidion resinicola]|uniref:Uncharacterized protein n=1 Tax=Mytilinidion resinicola TaxID=574789 RepID=A0A6A6YXB8_9PEZI|nr:uncharacterized protein BDZ99DRAFT_474224 [Mytilinidion resinicola]KAF2813592.1 hypothetical protein BDZ99DRAFT_474224 [Mytilinidion resinicola]
MNQSYHVYLNLAPYKRRKPAAMPSNLDSPNPLMEWEAKGGPEHVESFISGWPQNEIDSFYDMVNEGVNPNCPFWNLKGPTAMRQVRAEQLQALANQAASLITYAVPPEYLELCVMKGGQTDPNTLGVLGLLGVDSLG